MATVLIVEDSNYVRNVVRNTLTDAGHTVVGELADGHEVMPKLQEQVPDILFLDIILPGITGLDLLKIVKAQFPRLKIIVGSIIEDAAIQQEAMHAGAVTYVCKPYTEDSIRKALQTALA